MPDITYCITITNSSVSDMCGITDTHYLFQQDFNPCVEYNVTVTPVNEVGNGNSSLLSFPSKTEDTPVYYNRLIYTVIVPGIVTLQDCVPRVLPNGTIKYQITLVRNTYIIIIIISFLIIIFRVTQCVHVK